MSSLLHWHNLCLALVAEFIIHRSVSCQNLYTPCPSSIHWQIQSSSWFVSSSYIVEWILLSRLCNKGIGYQKLGQIIRSILRKCVLCQKIILHTSNTSTAKVSNTVCCTFPCNWGGFHRSIVCKKFRGWTEGLHLPIYLCQHKSCALGSCDRFNRGNSYKHSDDLLAMNPFPSWWFQTFSQLQRELRSCSTLPP